MSSRWGPRIDVRPLLGPEQDALLCYLRALSADDWDVVTAADPWRVRDVAAHLLGDHLGRLSRSRDGHPPPPPAPGEGLGPFLHRFNAEWVAATARLSIWVLLELLGDVGPRVVDHWQRLDLDAFGEAVSWADDGEAPVWLDAARGRCLAGAHPQSRVRSEHIAGARVDTRLSRPLPRRCASAVRVRSEHIADARVDTRLSRPPRRR